MAASDARIPCSHATRRELRVLKATEGHETYDEALSTLLKAYNAEKMDP